MVPQMNWNTVYTSRSHSERRAATTPGFPSGPTPLWLVQTPPICQNSVQAPVLQGQTEPVVWRLSQHILVYDSIPGDAIDIVLAIVAPCKRCLVNPILELRYDELVVFCYRELQAPGFLMVLL